MLGNRGAGAAAAAPPCRCSLQGRAGVPRGLWDARDGWGVGILLFWGFFFSGRHHKAEVDSAGRCGSA